MRRKNNVILNNAKARRSSRAPSNIYTAPARSTSLITPDKNFISGVLRCYLADNITGLSDGNSVFSWPDASAAGDPLVGATGTVPTYKTNVINGKPIVRFDGSTQFLTFKKLFDSSTSIGSIFVVCSVTSASANQAIISTRQTIDGANGWALAATGTTALYYNSGGTPQGATLTFTNSTFNILEIMKNGLVVTSGINGTMSAPVTINTYQPTSITYTGVGRGYAASPGTIFFGGDIYAILILDHIATPTERQLIEGWGLWAVGRQTTLPTTHPYRNSPPKGIPWTPAQVPTIAWWDFSNTNTITTATGISAIKDLSGNGFTMSQATGGTQPTITTNAINNLNVATLNGSQNLSSSRVFTTSNFCAIAVVSAAAGSSSAGQDVLSQYDSGGSTNRTIILQKYGVSPYNQVGVFFNTGSSYTVNSTTVAFDSTPHIICSESDGAGNWDCRVDGHAAEGSITGANLTPLNTSTEIGNRGNGLGGYTGNIAEIVVCTSSNRQLVEGYLAWKWGIASNLPSTHPYYSAPPVLSNLWTPAQLPNLQAWWDFSNVSSFTTATGINAITDLSGNMHTMLQATGTAQPTVTSGAINGLTAATFAVGQYLATTTEVFVTSNFCAVAIVSAAAATNQDIISQYDSGGSTNRIQILAKSDTGSYNTLKAFFNNGTSYSLYSTTVAFDSTPHMICSGSYGGGHWELHVDGNVAEGSINSAPLIPLNTVTYIGARGNSLGSFAGVIGEIVICSLDNRQLVEGYLAWKWKTNTKLPSSHPYYSNPPTINNINYNVTSWLPSLLNTALWLDASDASTITIATGVSQWNDKSGNSRYLTQATGANQPTISTGSLNNLNTLVFNGTTQYMTSAASFPITGNPAFSTFIVYKKTNNTEGNTFGWGSYTASDYGFGLFDTGAGCGYAFANSNSYNVPAISNNTWQLAEFTKAAGPINTTSTAYLFGTAVSSGTPASTTPNIQSNPFCVGIWANDITAGYYLQGNIAEVIVLPYVATTIQRQLIEGYLAWKWGLNASLPVGHPFISNPPNMLLSNSNPMLTYSDYWKIESNETKWANRIGFTINGNKIASDLTNFPIRININQVAGSNGVDITSIIKILGSKNLKLSVIYPKQFGLPAKECKVEIEDWSTAYNTGALWVKVPFIKAGVNTQLYIYFDPTKSDNNTNVGVTGSVPAQKVWDSNYLGVWHMSQDPTGGSGCIKDSTSNAQNGTPTTITTAFVSSDLRYDPIVGRCLYFNGTNYINCGTPATISGELTLEVLASAYTSTSLSDAICIGSTDYNAIGTNFSIGANSVVGSSNGTSWTTSLTKANAINGWVYQYAAFNSVSNVTDTNASGSIVAVNDGFPLLNSNLIKLGAHYSLNASYMLQGVISEARVSKVARSTAWLNASYYSLMDTLITYSSIANSFEALTTTSSTWLTDASGSKWANRIKIDIDGTSLTSDLINFPVNINIGVNSGLINTDLSIVIKALGNSSLKLAVVQLDRKNKYQQQCYVEIDSWNYEGTSHLWVCVPCIRMGIINTLYLYYDKYKDDNSQYVGITGTAAAQNVWDTNFVAVYHMSQMPVLTTASIIDSTRNANHMTPYGTISASATFVGGSIGPGVYFDGSTNYATNTASVTLNNFTYESFVNPTALANQPFLVHFGTSGLVNTVSQSVTGIVDGVSTVCTMPIITTGTYSYVAGTKTTSTNITYNIYLNGTNPNSTFVSNTGFSLTNNQLCGGYSTNYFNGIVDETRVSNISRSPQWIYYTNLSLRDQLCRFGGLETVPNQNAIFNNGQPWHNQYGLNASSITDITRWTTVSNIPTARYGQMCFATKNRVYICGGHTTVDTTTVYTAPINSDGTLGSWATSTNSLPVVMEYASVVMTKGWVYLCGGYNSTTGSLSTIYVAPIYSDGTIGTWATNANSLPGTLFSSPVVVTKNRVYLCGGGTGVPASVVATSSIYTAPINTDGTLGTWTTATSLPSVLVYSNPVVTSNRVYICGGQTANGSGPVATVYTAPINTDGTLGTWATGTNLPGATKATAFQVITNNRAFLLGGSDSSVYTAPVNSDGTIGSWVTGTALPGTFSNGGIIVTSSMVYLIGGYTGSVSSVIYQAPFPGITNDYSTLTYTTTSNIVTSSYYTNGQPWRNQYTFNTAQTGSITGWTTGTSLNAPAVEPFLFVTKNRVYVCGGINATVDSSVVYTAPINSDGTIGTWVTGTSLPGTLSRGQTVLTKNRVYLIGGSSGATTATNTPVSTVYTAAINSDGLIGAWTSAPSLPGALSSGVSIVTKNRVYMCGGYNGSNVAIVYTAPINTDGTIGGWTTGTSIPVTLINSTAAVIGNNAYFFGGVMGGSLSNAIYTAPINTDGTLGTWTLSSITLPGGTDGGSNVVVTRNMIYYMGLYTGTTATTVYNAPIVNGVLGSWTTAGTSLPNGLGFGSAFVTSSMIYIVSGFIGSSSTTAVYQAPFAGGANDYFTSINYTATSVNTNIVLPEIYNPTNVQTQYQVTLKSKGLISSDLTNFPVLLNLNSVSGANNTDMTGLLSSIQVPYTETFSSRYQQSVINPDRWQFYWDTVDAAGNNGTHSVTNNGVTFSLTASKGFPVIVSKFLISGNVVVSVNYSTPSSFNTSAAYIAFIIRRCSFCLCYRKCLFLLQ